MARAYHGEALEAVKTEHAKYFEAIQQHPRQLVGQDVPSLTGEGTEKLKDAADAKDWQEAIKHILLEEVRDRATKAMEDNGDFLTTIHSSIELFQNNTDLIPGSKEFDVELANKFATLAKPYELRVDGKLQGYSIPVQPIIEQLRNELVAGRTVAPAAAEEPAATAAAGKPAAAPQEGLTSKAGSSADAGDDWQSALFGTLGLPNLRI